MASTPPPGKIITFYSYKGGTGRSMAVANVGYLLAETMPQGSRGVLMIDWDLEAPGLHRKPHDRPQAVGEVVHDGDDVEQLQHLAEHGNPGRYGQ